MANFPVLVEKASYVNIDDVAFANLANKAPPVFARIIIWQDPPAGTPMPTGSTVKVRLRALADIQIDEVLDPKLVPGTLQGSSLDYVANIRQSYPKMFVVGGPSEQDLAQFILDYNTAAAKSGKPRIVDQAQALALISTVGKLTP